MTRGSTVPLPLRIVALSLVVTLALPPVAFSNPQGAAVRHGQVRIQGGAGQLQIRQMTQRAVIDWESFSIDQGEITRFIQPGASSAVLNRVRGSNASQIEGMLRANGRVYLINPNGILIGPNGSVDVAGFVASTLDPGDRAFLRGGSMRFSGASDAAVINLGSISALDGDVVLMGASVLNAGEIRAPRGTAALAAGNDILLAESGEERVFVRGSGGSSKAEGVTNTGNIEANIAELKAHGGNVYGVAVKNEGRVAATGVTRRGGQIFLSAGGGKVRSTGTLKARKSDGSGGRVKVDSGTMGKTEIGGTVDASGDSGSGGEIAILGNEIEVFDGALILNDGETMGGTTRIGGGLQGREAAFSNSETVTVGNGAEISAKSLGSGDGGQVIVFSKGILTFDGHLSVAGANGGRGGFAELSGQREVFIRNLAEQVDLGASRGPAGTLLIDPIDVSVIDGANNGIVAGTSITDGSISFFLTNNGNLVINTSGTGGNGDITIANNANISWATGSNLTFLADRDFIMTGGAVVQATGSGAFSATAQRSLRLGTAASIATASGSLTLSGNPTAATTGQFEGIYLGSNASVSSGTGTISLTGRGGNGAGAGNHGIHLESTGTIGSLGGNILLDGRAGTTVGASPTQEGVLIKGNITTTGNGNITISGTGGNATSGNIGVNLFDDVVVSTLNGNISITGVSGAGTNSAGIQIADFGGSSTVITSTGGSITLIGNGSAGSSEGIRAFGSGTSIGGGTGHVEFTATGDLSLSSNAEIGAIGSGAVSLTSTRSISLGAGTSVSTVNGNLSLSANQQPVADNGDFIGILVDGATIQSTGVGQVSVRGRGGNRIIPFQNVDYQMGVSVRNGGKILGGTTGTLLVEGTGRQTASQRSNYNYGVQVSGSDSLISSNGADVSVTGTGGNGFNDNFGVAVGGFGRITSGGAGTVTVAGTGGNGDGYNDGISIFNGGVISSGGMGTVTLTGTAGTDAWDGSETFGLSIYGADSSITSGGGHVFVTGYGGIGGEESYGVIVQTGARITSGGGNVSVTGEARNVSHPQGAQGGVWVGAWESTITSGGGNVTVIGTGATGGEESYGVLVNSSGRITSGGTGTVSVTGTAGTAANYSEGVAIYSGGNVTSNNGSVTVNGTGGTATGPAGYSVGIRVHGTGSIITSGSMFQTIDITGTGGSGGAHENYGVIVNSSGQISATGFANLDITGNAGGGSHFSSGVALWGGGKILSESGFAEIVGTGATATNPGSTSFGVLVDGAGSQIGVTDGNLLVDGTGGTADGSSYGVLVNFSGVISATGSSVLTIDGTSGAGGDISYGVALFNDADILGGDSPVFVTGTSGTVTRSSGTGSGVALHAGNVINSTGGNVSVTGNGGTGGGRNAGVTFFGNGTISAGGNGLVSVTGYGGATGGSLINELSTGVAMLSNSTITSNSGAVSVTGFGGDANGPSGYSFGVRLSNTGTSITSGGGDVTITGTGGAVALESLGVMVSDSSQVSAGGTGSVLVEGTGGGGLQYNEGVTLLSGGTVTSGGGTVTVIGQGGTGDPLTDNYGSVGIGIYNAGSRITSGGGDIVVEGTGGIGPSDNNGIWIGGGGRIEGSTGTLSVTGTGGSDSLPSGLNHGIFIEGFGSRITGSGGNLTVTGIGGSDGGASHGVRLHDRGEIVYSGGGLLTVEGAAGIGGGFGISLSDQFNGGAAIRSTGSGNILLIADSLEIASNTETIQAGANTVTIRQRTNGHLINLGGADDSTRLGLSDAELDRITAGLVRIGNQNTGVFTVSSAITHGNHLSLTSGDWFDVHEGITMSTDRNLTLTTTESGDGYISLFGGNAQLSAAGTGAITLDVKRGIKIEHGGISTENGNLTLLANTADGVGNSSIGIELFDADLSTVNGAILLEGHPGPNVLTGDNDGIVISGASMIEATGTGSITLTTPRNIRIGSASGISSLNGNISLTANQGTVPTPGNFSGIDLDGASISSTGTGTVSLSGRGGDGEGGQHGILLRGGASVTANARNLTLSGAAPDPLSSGLRIELASLGAGGGTIQLTGSGGTTSISSTNASATIGSATDTVLIRSNSGDVSILGRIQGADLQVQDHSGTESVDFALTNTSNDIDRINSFSNGSNGRIASLDFRDTDGFLVTEFLGASGVSASGNITLRSNLYSGSSVVIDRPVRSAGGNVLLRGLDVVIDGTQVSATGSGSLTLEAGRAILVWDDSLLSVTNGAMSLEANRGEGSLEGNFTGITVLGSRLQSLGTGGISLSGAGGDGGPGSNFSFPGFTNPSSLGIRLDGGTVISSSDSSSNDFGIELYGDGGGGISNSIGISISGIDTILTSAGRSVLVEGWGGGDSSGQRNRGILFTGGLVQAANTGNVTLFGNGGSGVNENDGIQLDNGARVQVAGGELTLDGYAGETLGIGVMLGNTAGNLTVTGNGSATVKGTGTNAHGVFLGNNSALLGGANAEYVDVFSRGGNLTLRREITASGNVFVEADFGDVFIENEVNSGTGDIRIEGDNVTIDAPVTATDGDITVTFGDNGFIFEGEPEVLEDSPEPPFDGTGTINNLLTAGGRVRYFGGDGTGDVLTFAGYTISEIDLDIADLTDIENVVGTGSSDDRLQGPAAASNYQFTGPNQFNVGGVAFSAFENVLGGGGDDVFAFTGSASIDGALDGGSGINRLDYSGYGTGVVVDLPLGAATGIVGGFENITNFTGSGNIDTVTGPGSASIYTFTGIDAMQVGTVSVAGFENLIAGPLEDRFVFLPGSSLRGLLDGGFSPTPVNNVLDYAGFGAPVTVNLATSTAGNLPGGFTGINRFQGSGSTRDLFSGPNSPTTYLFAGPNSFGTPGFQATGFENLSGGVDSDTFVFAPNTSLSGNLSGGDGPGPDTLTYAFFGRPVTVNVGPNKAPGIGGRFEGIERIVGSPGNDRFNFLNQTTINFVDGGTGTDLIEINDSNLRGDNTYDVNANSVSRNPLYTFNNFEALRLFLGTGNNTVNSGFFPYTQFLHGGKGFNTLNLPGVTSLNGPSPIGNVHHFGFDAPRPGGVDTGGLLQLEVDQNNGGPDLNTGQDSLTENRFNIIDPATLNSQIAALGGAFSAAVVAQAVIASVDGNSYLVLRPFSLDGSGLSPSNLGLAALNESLGVDANLELAAAIGFDGPVFLFNPDGPYSIDLSGVPADPAILTLLQESLSIAAAAELSAAIGLTLTVSITGADGIVPTGLDGSVPGQNVVLIFGDQLGAPAEAELNAAIAGGN